MLERIGRIFKRQVSHHSSGEVEKWFSNLQKPTPEQSVEIRDSLITLTNEPSDAEVAAFYANLKPLSSEEALIERNELVDLAHETFPARKPHQPHLKI